MTRKIVIDRYKDQISNIRYLAGVLRGTQYDDAYVALKDAASGFERLLEAWTKLTEEGQVILMEQDWSQPERK